MLDVEDEVAAVVPGGSRAVMSLRMMAIMHPLFALRIVGGQLKIRVLW